MEVREILKVDEDSYRSPIYENKNITNRSMFVSQIDKDIGSGLKVEHINEGVYPSIDQRVNMSYFIENENYFGKDSSLIEENNKILSNFFDKDQIYNSGMPNRKELGLASLEMVSANNIRLSDSINISRSIFKNKTTNEERIKTFIFESFPENKLKYEHKSENEGLIKGYPFYSIVEKCQVKDYIGFHKLYEIQFYENEEKNIKCYRRYDNFDKFNSKLKKMYPYMLIPRLPAKNTLVKIVSPDEDFYENRRIQLNFYLNFLYKNESFFKTKEFFKFTNDAEFDEDYFDSKEDTLSYYYPESAKIYNTLSNRILGVFSGIFGGKEERKLTDEEILLRRMETHYKGVCDKYKEIKNNIFTYLKTIKINAENYKGLSNTCFYMKDTLPNVSDSKENFKMFHEICEEISKVNSKYYNNIGINLEYKFEV